MLFETFLLPGVIVPAVAAALVFGIVHAISRGHAKSRHGGGGLAIAIAFVATYVALTGWPRFPPIEASQRLFFIVAVIGILAWLYARWRGSALPWIVRGAVLAALLGLLLQSQIVHRWGTIESTLWLLGLLILGLAFESAFDRGLTTPGDDDRPSWRLTSLIAAGVPMALVGGTALALGLAESARLAQLTGALACAMLAVEILGRLIGRKPWHRGDSLALGFAVFGLLLIGFFYAQLNVLPAVLLIAAYLLLALPTASIWGRLAPLVPFAIALGIMIAAAVGEEDDPYDDYGAHNDGAPRHGTAVAHIQGTTTVDEASASMVSMSA